MKAIMISFEKISNTLAFNIAKSLNYDNDKKEVIAYGAYILLDTILAVGLVIIFGTIFSVLLQALLVSFIIAIFRKYSGGAHASTPVGCATIGMVIAVGFALIIKQIENSINMPIAIAYLVITFVISYIIVLQLAPKDSPNKPITKEEKIKKLKAKSINTLFAYAVICLIIIFYKYFFGTNLLPYVTLICSGYLWQAFTLTSAGHKFICIMDLPFRYINKTGGENK